MPQMDQPAAGTTCPNCAEPAEAEDRFCGACGHDLAARAAVSDPDDRATVALSVTGSATAHEQGGTAREHEGAGGAHAAGTEVQWPEAPEVDSSDRPVPVHDGGELPGLDSGGDELPPGEGQEEQREVRHDLRAGSAGQPEGDDYPLAAPAPADPRISGPAAQETPAAGTVVGGKVCVACRLGRVDTDGYCENCGHAQPRERDHLEEELGAVAAVSDRGLRHHRNEDAFAVSSTALPDGSEAVVAVVCDGVSSATRPDEASLAASRAANETLLAALPRGTHPQQAMHEAILAASEAVNSLAAPGEGHSDQNAPACTLVGAVVAGELLTVGWVGDSRAYWVPVDRAAPSARLTEDDSWAAQMVANGLMSEAEAYADERAHAITGWLGADAYEVEPHTASFKPDRPGVVVVCTDGLWNYAEAAEELARVLPVDASQRPLHSAQVLVGHALDGGGHDNVTVAVVPFPPPATGEVSA
ncbi:protein phosphatase 2C domain-containing protein [Streptomyces sp. NA04227]|uniref:PP2C family serine/threonine-protein phosphatase n=1 Tax=Streptomyces sp. NA04227 TaxID=2742136 RepID=UPI0015917DD1|nr:PP2C family serine/threonine-protein phosphatase [Streptomyces sp. NA04227]QKW06500.1 protein phosphatase 2C domain-containing protein [Streptomyces sp. NA04227]